MYSLIEQGMGSGGFTCHLSCFVHVGQSLFTISPFEVLVRGRHNWRRMHCPREPQDGSVQVVSLSCW